MPSLFQQKLLDTSSLTSKMLRKCFGRGPETCFAYAKGPFLVFYIRGFLSPLESTLLAAGNSDQVEISRDIVMRKFLHELKGIVELEFQQDVESFYHDWNYPQNTGMIAIEFAGEITPQQEYDETIDLKPLINEVERISILVQKKPEKTEAFMISPKVLLVKRDGILIKIEKKLIEKGYGQTLMVTKDELEKSYLHRNGHFEELLGSPVKDIFVDWDFHEDQSMICFILK